MHTGKKNVLREYWAKAEPILTFCIHSSVRTLCPKVINLQHTYVACVKSHPEYTHILSEMMEVARDSKGKKKKKVYEKQTTLFAAALKPY